MALRPLLMRCRLLWLLQLTRWPSGLFLLLLLLLRLLYVSFLCVNVNVTLM